MAPYSASRKHNEPKGDKESHADYEVRTWREKCHYTDNGHVVIPPESFSFAIKAMASRLRIRIPGKGQSEYGKLFTAGILIVDGLVLPETRDTVLSWSGSMNADGKRGSGKRVDRTFPMIPKWGGTLEIFVLDDEVPKDVFERVMNDCGKLNGVGRYRPAQGGTNGRFKVTKFKWSEQ
jgi:hypothetical protein